MSNKNILRENLAQIVEKYSEFNILFQLEKEYQSLPNKLVDVSQIDDNRFLKQFKFAKSDIITFIKAYEAANFVAPLIVRQKNDHYEVVIGRKRLHAARTIKLDQIHVLIGDYTDEEVLLMLLAVARDEHNVNIIELALIFKNLITSFNYKQEHLAKLSHLSRPQVTNILRLLNLPEVVVNDVIKNKLSFGHARALVTQPEDIIIELAEITKKQKLNVRQLEELVRAKRSSKEVKKTKPYQISEDELSLNISFNNKKDKNKVLTLLKKHYGD